jgi:LysM repeat protein
MYYNVGKGDSCAKIETAYDITFAQLYKWNPAIGDDCQTLEVGTAVCVGVSS